MLARLPRLLAQIKAGNNSRELKNEIRTIVFSIQVKTNKQNSL